MLVVVLLADGARGEGACFDPVDPTPSDSIPIVAGVAIGGETKDVVLPPEWVGLRPTTLRAVYGAVDLMDTRAVVRRVSTGQ